MSDTIKKRRFGIPNSLGKGLTNTISMAENHVIDFKNAVIPLSYVETDPNNPRRMKISLEEIKNGINEKDSHYAEKSKELDALKELAWSIEKKGLINPITLYQKGEKYRLVAGERRYLASLLANKQEIEARIYKSIPRDEDLKLVQWIENTARADLSLADKLANIEAIFHFYKAKSTQNLDVEILMNLTGLAKTNAYRYLNILNNELIRTSITDGTIDSLRTAATLAEIRDASKLAEAIALYKQGDSVDHIVKLIKTKKPQETAKSGQAKKSSKASTGVNLGKVKHGKVVKVLVDALIENPSYTHLNKIFANVNWDNFKDVTQSFKKMLSILEREI